MSNKTTEDLNKSIKLIASTKENFAELDIFRATLPAHCKPQIESIGFGFAGFEIRYRELHGKTVILPSNPRQMTHQDDFVRVYYKGMHILVPWKTQTIDIQFADAN